MELSKNIKFNFTHDESTMYKNDLNFHILNFEYDEYEGILLTPWANQFSTKLHPNNVRRIGYKGFGYSINLFDSKVTILSSTVSPNVWSIRYNCYEFQIEQYQKVLKNLSFDCPEDMSGYIGGVETDIVTGVHSYQGGAYSQCGIRLNCIFLDLSKESWIYIRNDHPIITKKINRNKIMCFDKPLLSDEKLKSCYQIHYECEGPFEWFKIHPSQLEIKIDQWTEFWGMSDIWNLEEKDAKFIEARRMF